MANIKFYINEGHDQYENRKLLLCYIERIFAENGMYRSVKWK